MASPQNYTLGRGKLYIALFAPGTQVPGHFRYIGNTPSITMTSDSETLDHYSSDQGVRNKDESVLLQLDRSGAFTTDSVRPENLALMLQGDYNAVTTAASTDVTSNIAGAVQGGSYQLGESPTAPAGVRMVKTVVVKDDDTPATTFVAGTDYVVDLERGLLTILEVEGGGIPAGTNLEVTFDVEASVRDQVIAGTRTVEGAMRYIADNPAGRNFDYMWPWIKISPNGDFELKGDEWQTLPFNFEILVKEPLAPVYVNGEARRTAAP